MPTIARSSCYHRRMPSARVLVGVLAGVLVSCLAAGLPCPCGQSYDRDPSGSEDFFIEIDHDESAHCFCRCGDGPRERLAPASTCDIYEGPCRATDGTLAMSACE
jgi:hypothetical protein